MESSHDLDIQKATNRLVDDLAIELAFADLVRGFRMSAGDRSITADEVVGSPLLWILRIVAVLSTVVMALITVAGFREHVLLGIASLFFLPVIVLGFVLVSEGVCKRVFRLS